MKIINKRENLTSFDSLNEGDVFMYADGIYMKTETSYPDDNGDYDNAVALKCGGLCYFRSSTMVHLINCELVIE